MCGVAGFVFSKNPPEKWFKRITKMLILSESRGNHATGIFLWDGKKSITIKKPVGAEKFVKLPEYKHLAKWKPRVCLAHTRWATQGNPQVNANNHPLVTRNFVLIHNGVISNDKELRERYRLARLPEVDSYVIIALIEKFYDIYHSVKRAIDYTQELLEGSYVCVVFDKNTGTVYKFRNGYSWHEDTKKSGQFWWASEDDILKGIQRYSVYDNYTYSHAGYGGYGQVGRIVRRGGYGTNSDGYSAIRNIHPATCQCSVCWEEYNDFGHLNHWTHQRVDTTRNGNPVKCYRCGQLFLWERYEDDSCPTCSGHSFEFVTMEDIRKFNESLGEVSEKEAAEDIEHDKDCLCDKCMEEPDEDLPYMTREEANEFHRETGCMD